MIKIENLSDVITIDGFSKAESALITRNSLPIKTREDYNEYFPDLITDYKYPRYLLKDLSKLIGTDDFVDRLNKFNKNDLICLASDYDSDGIMSAVIMGTTLDLLGYNNVSISIPNRLDDHYGMKLSDIDEKLKSGVKLFITSDNGISEKEAVDKIKAAGSDIIVTDHHLPSDDVPDTLIIDPKYNNDSFGDICGAVVVLKLAYALYISQKGSLSDNIYPWDTMVSLAAIATITDAMPMIKENRLLVRALLNQINSGKAFELNHILTGFGAGRDIRMITEGSKHATEDLIMFTVGPAINAISRVDGNVVPLVTDMIQYLTGKLRKFPSYSSYNYTRKDETTELLRDFLHDNHGHDNTPIVYTYDRSKYDFNPKGIYGLIANKSLGIFGSVSLVGSKCSNGTYEFSGRSPAGYDLHAGIERIKESHPELGISGGGHSCAMGIRLPDEKSVETFKTLLIEDAAINTKATEEVVYEYDEKNDDDKAAITAMYMMQPFGEGFRKLEFHHKGRVHVDPIDIYNLDIEGLPCKVRYYGKNNEKLDGKVLDFTFVPQYDESSIYYKIERML